MATEASHTDGILPPLESPTTGGEPQLKLALGPGLLLLFIIGDVLGTSVYALTGQIAGQVGGAAWAPFLIAFAVATATALSYLELVTKYPRAAGAALYAHKAFGIHIVTFLVTFVLTMAGITSSATAARAFSVNLLVALHLEGNTLTIALIALGFLAALMVVNLRGVTQGLWLNVILTCVELSGLLLVLGLGVWAIGGGHADFSRVIVFESPDDKTMLLALSTATSLAFFAMVGFEDSVNMVEETRNAQRIFPRIMLTGLSITAVIYVAVSICVVALVPVGALATSEVPLVLAARAAAPDFPIAELLPFISMFAVANTALLNMLMASRLLYGMSRQKVLPAFLGHVDRRRQTPWTAVLFSTAVAMALSVWVSTTPSSAKNSVVALLGGTTSLLLLAVFAVVNVAVIVLRRDAVRHSHFRTRVVVAIFGVISCIYLVLPWTSGRPDGQYQIALVLAGIGVALFAIERLASAMAGRRKSVRTQNGSETAS